MWKRRRWRRTATSSSHSGIESHDARVRMRDMRAGDVLLDGELPRRLEGAHVALIENGRELDVLDVVVVGQVFLHDESTAMLEETNGTAKVVERGERRVLYRGRFHGSC